MLRRWGSRRTLPHGVLDAELGHGVWTGLEASCICSCLVCRYSIFSLQEPPEWGKGFVWLHTGLDGTAGFCTVF